MHGYLNAVRFCTPSLQTFRGNSLKSLGPPRTAGKRKACTLVRFLFIYHAQAPLLSQESNTAVVGVRPAPPRTANNLKKEHSPHGPHSSSGRCSLASMASKIEAMTPTGGDGLKAVFSGFQINTRRLQGRLWFVTIFFQRTSRNIKNKQTDSLFCRVGLVNSEYR